MSAQDFRRFVNPPPVPDLRWGVYIEERIGIMPVSHKLYSYDDPAEAWTCLMRLLERVTRKRLFYIKESGRTQRWTDYRKEIRYLFSYKRSRYYLDYRHFVQYAAGKADYQPPPPDEPEVDAELLMIPDCAVEDRAAVKRAATTAIKQALSTQSEWSARQKKRRL